MKNIGISFGRDDNIISFVAMNIEIDRLALPAKNNAFKKTHKSNMQANTTRVIVM